MQYFSSKEFLFNIYKSSGRIAVLDIGSKKSGIAISNDNRKFCAYKENFSTPQSLSKFYEFLESTIIEHKLIGIVFGVTQSNDGLYTPISQSLIHFTQEYKKELDHISILFYDERFSTAYANRILKMDNKPRKERNKIDDSSAAIILLNELLDAEKNIR